MNKVNFEDFITDAQTIMNTNYEPTQFIIDSLLPAKGLVLLAGGPKIGKSLLTTQLLCSVSGNSDFFLGHKVNIHGISLYLALEDTPQRIKDRILKQNYSPDNQNLKIAFNWSHDEKAIKDLKLYKELNPELKLIVIDTKGKLCKEQGTSISYQSDYNFFGSLKEFADENNLSVIVITHLRKKASQEDVFNEICGTSAVMGAADTVMLIKRPRNQNHGILSLTSRDYEEREEDIYLDYSTLTWHSNGEISTAIPNMTPERQAIISALEEIGKPSKPSKIAELLGKDNKVISNMLAKMKEFGFVKKSKKLSGYWMLPDWEEENNTQEEEYEFI